MFEDVEMQEQPHEKDDHNLLIRYLLIHYQYFTIFFLLRDILDNFSEHFHSKPTNKVSARVAPHLRKRGLAIVQYQVHMFSDHNRACC